MLLSAPSTKVVEDSVPRNDVAYKNLSGPYKITNANFERQYSHTYYHRLKTLRPRADESAQKKWSDLSLSKRVIDLKINTECIITGTLFKTMKLKPNILDQFKESSIMEGPKPIPDTFVSDEDTLGLEDQTGRVIITLDADSLKYVDPARLVSGLVVGIRGFMQDTGELLARDICYPMPSKNTTSQTSSSSSSSSPSTSSSTPTSGTVVLMSGIRVGPGSGSKLLPLQLLADYVTGHVGSPNEQKSSSANICRVIVCGNTLDMQDALEAADKAHAHGTDYKASASSSSSGTSSRNDMEAEAEPLRIADNLLSQFARSVNVDVMPGVSDPSNVALPQQPLHNVLFPRSSGYRDTFQLVTNPYKCEIGNTTLLGHSGQPIADILKYSNVGHPSKHSTEIDNDSTDAANSNVQGDALIQLAALEATLKWQHLAPTAPDTLPCFPFQNRDPFILSGKVPEILYMGNSDDFTTKVITLEDGRTVRLVTVPDFSKTNKVVLLDLATNECRSLTLSIDSDMMEVETNADSMDIDEDMKDSQDSP